MNLLSNQVYQNLTLERDRQQEQFVVLRATSNLIESINSKWEETQDVLAAKNAVIDSLRERIQLSKEEVANSVREELRIEMEAAYEQRFNDNSALVNDRTSELELANVILSVNNHELRTENERLELEVETLQSEAENLQATIDSLQLELDNAQAL